MKKPQHYISEYSHLIKEWNWDKNKNCTPETIGAGSSQKVWWKCCICGNEWQATPNSRSGGKKCGCPECGKKISLSHRISTQIARCGSLATKHPYLLQEWDYKKNTILPEDIPTQTRLKVWWKCKDCGHEWQAVVQSRTRGGNGCPECGRAKATIIREHNKLLKTGSLIQTHPDLIKEWDYEKNKDINPYNITANNGGRFWWKCCECGHSWQAIVANRTSKGSGCPECAKMLRGKAYTSLAIINTGAIAKTHAQLLADWDYKKNIIQPEDISIGSDRKVWWKCHLCGYEWKSAPNSSNRRKNFEKGCPACQRKVIWIGHNDLATTNPSLASEWNYTKNGDLQPTMLNDGSNKKVWWKCKDCGHEWEAVIAKRTKGKCRCPSCKNIKSL